MISMYQKGNNNKMNNTQYIHNTLIIRIALAINNSTTKLLTFLFALIAVGLMRISVMFVFSFWITWDIYDILFCILYVTTLYKSRISCNNEMDNDSNNEWMTVIAKLMTLIFVSAGVTSIISYGYLITSWISFFGIGSIVNCWCVFLMYGNNQKLFECICGGCHKCIGKCVYFCVKDSVEKQTFLKIYERNERDLVTNDEISNVEGSKSVNTV